MTAKRSCYSCSRHLRRGKGRRAWIVEPDGALKYGVVCLRCAVRSVVLVPPPPTTVPPLCGVCRAAHASVCLGCYARVAEHARELVKTNVALHAVRGAS